jgi:hypothetical protein
MSSSIVKPIHWKQIYTNHYFNVRTIDGNKLRGHQNFFVFTIINFDNKDESVIFTLRYYTKRHRSRKSKLQENKTEQRYEISNRGECTISYGLWDCKMVIEQNLKINKDICVKNDLCVGQRKKHCTDTQHLCICEEENGFTVTFYVTGNVPTLNPVPTLHARYVVLSATCVTGFKATTADGDEYIQTINKKKPIRSNNKLKKVKRRKITSQSSNKHKPIIPLVHNMCKQSSTIDQFSIDSYEPVIPSMYNMYKQSSSIDQSSMNFYGPSVPLIHNSYEQLPTINQFSIESCEPKLEQNVYDQIDSFLNDN